MFSGQSRLVPGRVFGIAILSAYTSILALAAVKPQAPRAAPKPIPKAAASTVKPADNSYCYTCHTNFKHEGIAETHRKNGVGCSTCHGESDKHASDENNITPPDIMYAKEKITGACMKCHLEGRLKKADKRLKQPVHALRLAGKATEKLFCTDCHGSHRLPVRTRRWDKNTGKLISDDGVRMVK